MLEKHLIQFRKLIHTVELRYHEPFQDFSNLQQLRPKVLSIPSVNPTILSLISRTPDYSNQSLFPLNIREIPLYIVEAKLLDAKTL